MMLRGFFLPTVNPHVMLLETTFSYTNLTLLSLFYYSCSFLLPSTLLNRNFMFNLYFLCNFKFVYVGRFNHFSISC